MKVYGQFYDRYTMELGSVFLPHAQSYHTATKFYVVIHLGGWARLRLQFRGFRGGV